MTVNLLTEKRHFGIFWEILIFFNSRTARKKLRMCQQNKTDKKSSVTRKDMNEATNLLIKRLF